MRKRRATGNGRKGREPFPKWLMKSGGSLKCFSHRFAFVGEIKINVMALNVLQTIFIEFPPPKATQLCVSFHFNPRFAVQVRVTSNLPPTKGRKLEFHYTNSLKENEFASDRRKFVPASREPLPWIFIARVKRSRLSLAGKRIFHAAEMKLPFSFTQTKWIRFPSPSPRLVLMMIRNVNKFLHCLFRHPPRASWVRRPRPITHPSAHVYTCWVCKGKLIDI